jgi:hypothetical protein
MSADDELAAGFPAIELFSSYLADVLEAAQVNDLARKVADDALRSSIDLAEQAWRARSLDPESAEPSDPGHDWTRLGIAAAVLSAYAAPDMYRIRRLVTEVRS